MKNTITNWNNERLHYADYATMQMIHDNNISQEDVKFILRARRQKKKAIKRKNQIIDVIYFLLGLTTFYLFMASVGIVENSVDCGWDVVFQSLTLMGAGLVLGWFCYNRGRYSDAIKDVVRCILKGICIVILFIHSVFCSIRKSIKKINAAR